MVTMTEQAERDVESVILEQTGFATEAFYTRRDGTSKFIRAIRSPMSVGRRYGDSDRVSVSTTRFEASNGDDGIEITLPGDIVVDLTDSRSYHVDNAQSACGLLIIEATAIVPEMGDVVFSVERAVHASDGLTTTTATWVSVIGGMRGSFEPVSAEDVPRGREDKVITHIVHAPYSQAGVDGALRFVVNTYRGDPVQSELRLVVDVGPRRRYFEVVYAYDLAEQNRMVRMQTREHQSGWFVSD